jgi:hypothetical protein
MPSNSTLTLSQGSRRRADLRLAKITGTQTLARYTLGCSIKVAIPKFRRTARFVYRTNYPCCGSHHQLALDSSASQSQIISDAVKCSSIAHLFHFYPILCEIASIPRKTPSTWVSIKSVHPSSFLSSTKSARDDQVVELDARTLARACLKEIGKEMGIN